MKRLSIIFAALLVSVSSLFAADEVHKTISFASTNSTRGDNVQNYITTWTSTTEGFEVSLSNFNNNNWNKWEYVKAGKKNGTTTGTITTTAVIDKAITKVVVTVDAIANGSVTATTLEAASDAKFTTDLVTVSTADYANAGSWEYELTSTAENKYYRLSFTCNNTTSNNNGVITISKIEYYKAAADKNANAVALDKSTLELEQYKYVTLKATPNPTDATDEWEWASSNTDVATVDANGKVTVVAATGTADITVTSKTTPTVTATCTVTAKAATAITVAEAVEIGSALSKSYEIAAGGMYVIRGYVTALTGTAPAEQFKTYGNYSVYIDDTKGGNPAFEAWRVVPTDGKSIAEVGDSVEVIGDITKLNTTIETAEGGSIKILKKVTYTVTPLSNDADMGNVRGGGTFDRKDSATVRATAFLGFEFVAWVAENKTDTLSKEATYKFEVTQDAKVYAIFKAEQSLTPATWYGQAPLTGTLNGTNPEVNYSIVYEITRTELRYLTVKCEINDEAAAVTGFTPQLVFDGSACYRLVKDDAMGIYSYTTTKKYTDGEIVKIKFYMAYAGGSTYADEISYTVGSSNNKPTAIETVSNNDTKATKRIVNGVLVIEKNGVRYNAQGVVME